MLWLLSAIASMFWFFGLVIGSMGLWIHVVLLLAIILVAIELIGGRGNYMFTH